MKGEKSTETIYRVIMRVAPAIILNGTKTIDLGEGLQIHIEESIHPEMKVPDGLKIISSINADSIEKAISRIRGYSNRILSLFSFLTTTSLPEILPVKCYDITPGKKEGTFVQYNYGVPMDTISARAVDIGELKTSIGRINALSEEYNNRIYRAMHWYKLAIRSRDFLDRFTSLWIGLETINPILRDHYKLEVEYSQCTNCKHQTTPILNGVTHLLKESSGDEKIWRKVRNIRAGTIHGFRDFKDIIQEIRELVPVLEKSLNKGLRSILGIGNRTAMESLDLGHPRPAFYQSHAMVIGPNLSLIDKNSIPSIGFDFESVGIHPGRQGHQFDVRISIDADFEFKEVQHALHAKEFVGTNFEFAPKFNEE